MERWSPTKAKEALGKNHVNRTVRESKVVMYARDMKEGRWTFCPDPISFNEKGELINGQHRLTAQIREGKTINWVVVRNAAEDVQKTMDTGAVRNVADMLTFEGLSSSRTLGAVARLALQMETGRIYSQKSEAIASATEIIEFVMKHPELEHSTKVGQHAAKTGILRTAPSALGAAHWWIGRHAGQGEADAFLHRLGTLVGEKEGSPVIALVKRLNEISRNKMRIQSRWLVYMVIKCWNYDVAEMPIVKISATTRDGEYKLLVPRKRGDKEPLVEDEDE